MEPPECDIKEHIGPKRITYRCTQCGKWSWSPRVYVYCKCDGPSNKPYEDFTKRCGYCRLYHRPSMLNDYEDDKLCPGCQKEADRQLAEIVESRKCR